jgi:hypothetical protein
MIFARYNIQPFKIYYGAFVLESSNAVHVEYSEFRKCNINHVNFMLPQIIEQNKDMIQKALTTWEIVRTFIQGEFLSNEGNMDIILKFGFDADVD